MVLADDEEREYGDAEAAEQKKADYEERGIGVISMRDDFAVIYGEDVVKTGDLNKPENHADSSISAVPEVESETAQTDPDVQYVMYRGTNDKDTNSPVFTQAEALEKVKDILIRHFGGYTIQEAHGGWIDSDIEYQESVCSFSGEHAVSGSDNS